MLMRSAVLGAFIGFGVYGIAWAAADDSDPAAASCDIETAILEWLPAATSGDMDAQFRLAVSYNLGSGAPTDYAEAAKWYRFASEQGLPEAQYNLATLYRKGQGVARDNREAARWYGLAAAQGLPRAQYNLGLLLSNDDGEDKDLVQAYKWFSVAGSSLPPGGYRDRALSRRDDVAALLTPAQITTAQGLTMDWTPGTSTRQDK